ncbi:MAG: polymerase sigma-70 factor, subfamily [Myxococcaceae bacterium]|nr:polymerase sigma-70 factor, subfamily [Myxococcaceae bacterium]MEA2748995.1 hypothetical protein [Myxococcales bacterium]
MTVDEHLFRREAGRLVAALTRVFGVHNLALAEDVAQDALCRALEVWKLRGIPENPSAWLMTTAKNRALDVLRRERTARTFAPEVGWLLESEWTLVPTLDELLEPNAIRDDELRMMFSCCHPVLSEDAQVALVLHILCGFAVAEIASAFLSSKAAIEKRITRGKKALAASTSLFDLASAEDFTSRLPTVQRALYLLFNEGYHGAGESPVRVELCEEAMRLSALLLGHAPAATPASHALAALMCFHAARLPARVDDAGDLVSLLHQDRTRWDRRLLAEGVRLLELSATGSDVSPYHLEAAIAAAHTQAPSAAETRWDVIVSLYDMLLAIRATPVVALQRALAVAELSGPAKGLEAIGAIADRERLVSYPFYFAALGELELRNANPGAAADHLRAAHSLARNAMDRRFLAARLESCRAVKPLARDTSR